MITGYIASATPLKRNINVRAEPSTRAPIVGTLRYGRSIPVLVVGEDSNRNAGSGWVRVEYAGIEAFVAKHVVRVEMDR